MVSEAGLESIPKIYIVILNWNGWADTIECLESVFRLNYNHFRVIVCDNSSSDGSLDYIKAWADGRLDIYVPLQNIMRGLTFPPMRKPVTYVEYERLQAEAGGNRNDIDSQLIMIHTGANLGFAGGNNVGLRYVMAKDDADYIWLLNNDTVIDPMALSFLVKKLRTRPEAGICGTTLLYYDEPDLVQAFGGASFNKYRAKSKHISQGRHFELPVSEKEIAEKTDYVVGASMFVTKMFLAKVGLLSEEYFLFFEEIDWCSRAKAVFNICFSSQSIVYHKEGASIGSSRDTSLASCLADYYSIRNRLTYTRKHNPILLPIVFMSLLMTFLNRLRRAHFTKAKQILEIMIDQIIDTVTFKKG